MVGSNDLTGTIGTDIGLLTNLQALDASGSHLDGTIPSELGHLGQLRILNMGYNLFANNIPTELGKLNLLSKSEVCARGQSSTFRIFEPLTYS